ncbi:MAG: hypothetical protein ACLFQV_01940, partial [Vulcanimicrobiota bacterium]
MKMKKYIPFISKKQQEESSTVACFLALLAFLMPATGSSYYIYRNYGPQGFRHLKNYFGMNILWGIGFLVGYIAALFILVFFYMMFTDIFRGLKNRKINRKQFLSSFGGEFVNIKNEDIHWPDLFFTTPREDVKITVLSSKWLWKGRVHDKPAGWGRRNLEYRVENKEKDMP